MNPGELPPPLTFEKLRKPHASIPHNPLIAEPMFLAAYAEKAGSGILDMMQLCRHAGLREPAFRQDGGQFVQTIWRPKTAPASVKSEQATEQVGEQVTEQVKRLLHSLANRTEGTRQIMRSLRLRHRPTLLYDYLQPALNGGLVEMTQPSSPKSPTQEYRLTSKGRDWLVKEKS